MWTLGGGIVNKVKLVTHTHTHTHRCAFLGTNVPVVCATFNLNRIWVFQTTNFCHVYIAHLAPPSPFVYQLLREPSMNEYRRTPTTVGDHIHSTTGLLGIFFFFSTFFVPSKLITWSHQAYLAHILDILNPLVVGSISGFICITELVEHCTSW